MARTDVLTIRLEDGEKQRFNDLCDKAGVKPGELVENLIADYYDCEIAITGGHIIGKPAENGAYTEIDETYTDDINYHALGLDTFVQLLRKREYPDEYIRKFVDNMISSAYEMPKFNQKRMRSNDIEC